MPLKSIQHPISLGFIQDSDHGIITIKGAGTLKNVNHKNFHPRTSMHFMPYSQTVKAYPGLIRRFVKMHSCAIYLKHRLIPAVTLHRKDAQTGSFRENIDIFLASQSYISISTFSVCQSSTSGFRPPPELIGFGRRRPLRMICTW